MEPALKECSGWDLTREVFQAFDVPAVKFHLRFTDPRFKFRFAYHFDKDIQPRETLNNLTGATLFDVALCRDFWQFS